jgi:surface antigen
MLMKKIVVLGCFSVMITLCSCGRLQQYSAGDRQASAEEQGVDNTSNILASRVFYGTDKIHKVAGGQLLFDYLLDEEIGQYMDWQDIIYMQNAVLQTPVNAKFTWTNARRKVTYTVRPTGITYNAVTHQYCRSYTLVVKVKDQIERTSGRVCHEADGRWHVA